MASVLSRKYVGIRRPMHPILRCRSLVEYWWGYAPSSRLAAWAPRPPRCVNLFPGQDTSPRFSPVADAPRNSAEAASSLSRRRKPLWRRRGGVACAEPVEVRRGPARRGMPARLATLRAHRRRDSGQAEATIEGGSSCVPRRSLDEAGSAKGRRVAAKPCAKQGEDGPSVTQQAPSYPPMQQRVGEKCRLWLTSRPLRPRARGS